MTKTNEKVCTSTHDKPISFLLLGLGQQQIKPDLKLLDPTELGEHKTLTSYDLPCRPWPCATSKNHRTDHARHMHCMLAAPAAASLDQPSHIHPEEHIRTRHIQGKGSTTQGEKRF
jgi:hypothetical protein